VRILRDVPNGSPRDLPWLTSVTKAIAGRTAAGDWWLSLRRDDGRFVSLSLGRVAGSEAWRDVRLLRVSVPPVVFKTPPGIVEAVIRGHRKGTFVTVETDSSHYLHITYRVPTTGYVREWTLISLDRLSFRGHSGADRFVGRIETTEFTVYGRDGPDELDVANDSEGDFVVGGDGEDTLTGDAGDTLTQEI